MIELTFTFLVSKCNEFRDLIALRSNCNPRIYIMTKHDFQKKLFVVNYFF